MPIVAAIVAIAAAAASAAAQAKQARENEKRLKEQKALEEQNASYNAQVMEKNAWIAAQQSQNEARAVSRKNSLVLGAQRASLAKSGVDISGTADDLVYNSAVEAEMDRMAVLFAGGTQANAFRAKAQDTRNQSTLVSKRYDQAISNEQAQFTQAIIGGVGGTAKAASPMIH